jgi:uncharacterized cupredoxin-like copper-binding protein
VSRRAFTIVAACAAVLVPGAGSALAAPSHHAATSATTITVTATEFKFKLSKTSAPKGSVTFKLVNKGKLQHDFKINGKKTATIAGGKTASVTVTFAKAGKFPYLCTVPGHAAAGMKGTFTVT